MYTQFVRPLLFQLNPETAHTLTIEVCRMAGRLPPVRHLFRRCFNVTDPLLQTSLGGLPIGNPIGLAAGWDKSGHAARMLGYLGFGFAEIGSISADFSAGNPRPRLFRLPQDEAVVVYYGLPNEGAAVIARRLAGLGDRTVPLGVNIVKTNRGPGAPPDSIDDTMDDYVRSFRQLSPHADYMMLNLSCPNASGGKDLFADVEYIGRLLDLIAVQEVKLPVFLKVMPSADPAFIEALLEKVAPHVWVNGFCFNLSPGKPDWLRLKTSSDIWSQMPGAVSGPPVEKLANSCISELYTRMPRNRFEIVGVGGVSSAEDAYRKICLGASAVQIYTAMIYQGPGVIRTLNEGLCDLLRRDGFTNIREAVGSAHT